MTLSMRDVGGLRGSPTGWLAVGAAGVGALLLAGRTVGCHPPACLLRSETGVPCPVCGLTRLTVHLAQGDVATAVTRDLPGTMFLALLTLGALAQLGTVLTRTPGSEQHGGRGERRPFATVGTGSISSALVRSPLLPALLVAALLAHWGLTALTGGIIT